MVKEPYKKEEAHPVWDGPLCIVRRRGHLPPLETLRGEGNLLEGVGIALGRTDEPVGRQFVQTSRPIVPVAESVGELAIGVGHDGLFATTSGGRGRNTGDNHKTFLAGDDTIESFFDTIDVETIVFVEVNAVNHTEAVATDNVSRTDRERLGDNGVGNQLLVSIGADKSRATFLGEIGLGKTLGDVGNSDTVVRS